MAYDAIGRRTRKSVDGQRTFFAWDGDALLAEKHEDQPAREYVYYPGTFEPLALIDTDGQLYYYHNDLNGLPRELTRPNGTIVWSATYDALGRVEEIQTDDIAQPLRMQGQHWDDEIGLCYNRYRYFDPQICSFISQDPIGLAGGENVYAYAPNVWGWVDPLGLCPKDASKSVTLDASEIRFSQSNVRKTLPEITQSMKANGWQGAPIDVVRMSDGTLIAVDNTRLAAASLSKTPVKAIIRNFDEAFPATRAGGNLQGATWGEAVLNRVGGQKPAWQRLYPSGSPFTGVHPSTPGFSP
jgi:RHS repeat-associated protein